MRANHRDNPKEADGRLLELELPQLLSLANALNTLCIPG